VNIAESWEIAAHPHGDTKVANGPLRGRSLAALTSEYGSELTGTFASPGRFPLLVKLLDAHEKLSVQVHPDDVYARTHEDGELGKSEMWVVLHAEPEAALVLGLQPGATREAFGEALAAGRLEEWLHVLPVQAGDAVCVPAGTLHAILGGTVIAEIQQNSDATYRVYDWNRAGADGKPRPLHVDKAMEVIDFQPGAAWAGAAGAGRGARRDSAAGELCRAPYVRCRAGSAGSGRRFGRRRCDGESLEIWGTIAGRRGWKRRGWRCACRRCGFALLPATVGPFAVAAADAG
jgi:mannose-6-phosphate isomerase